MIVKFIRLYKNVGAEKCYVFTKTVGKKKALILSTDYCLLSAAQYMSIMP